MTIEIPLPDWSALPVWAWWATGITGWYLFAGLVFRIDAWFGSYSEKDRAEVAGLWVFSPVVLPFCFVVLTVVYGGSFVAWVFTFGTANPPWKWSDKET